MALWRAVEGGLRVAVKVQPKSRRPGLGGRAPDIDGERLRIGVAEAAEDGRANRAACAALAQALAVKPADVSVALGAASRDKTLLVAGDAAVLAARLEAL
ncbi:MAG: DUF167 domain-containing protein [Acetobacteraceae bacterium]|nr:DUF167 domain-containing protein [Acetobacteraceae bacterium]